MTDAPDNPPSPSFDPRSVSWGYQQVFADAVARLTADGVLGGPESPAARTIQDMLDRATPGSFDHVVKEFLSAMNPRTRWLLGAGGVFEDLCQLGCEIASDRLAHGIAFFRAWGEGAFGQTPEQVRALLQHTRALRQIDGELAQAFLPAYRGLVDRLTLEQVQQFVNWLVLLHGRNRRTAIDSAALRLQAARVFVESLSIQCRLEDARARLERLTRAVSGGGMEIADFGQLDSDNLILRGSKVVCYAGHLFLPVRMQWRDSRAGNEGLYLASAVMSAAAVRWRSFAALHGPGQASTIESYAGDPQRAAWTYVLEVARVSDRCRRELPGSATLIALAAEAEFAAQPPRGLADGLLASVLTGQGEGPMADLAQRVLATVRQADSVADSLRLADAFRREPDCPPLGEPRALLLFPDPYYPAELSAPPADALVADLHNARPLQPEPEEEPTQEQPSAASADENEDQNESAVRAGFVYPEWNQARNDYYVDWCLLREHRPQPHPRFRPPADESRDQDVQRARRMFQRLRPELMRKEKLLPHGDEINIDLLVRYLARRHRLPSPRVDFYQKKHLHRRDLAVALLLDVSGSTANEPGTPPLVAADSSAPRPGRRIIDLEKRAALILGEGLDILGDAFGIYGFSGNGRESCDFYVYKDLDEPFDHPQHQRLLAAFPAASTRIGVAVRHCLWRLGQHPARTKIILLITDGRPQDSDYDPATRYAQYDVRMACQECDRQDVHVVCISTLENSRADLEIMFPHRRFVILEDMSQLVDVLPRLYLSMTC